MTRLLVVLIVILLLAGIGIGVGTSVTSTGNGASQVSTNQAAMDASCNADAKSLEAAAQAYQAQVGRFPSDVSALVSTTMVNGQDDGPWLRTMPNSTAYTLTIAPNGDVIVHSKTGRGGGDYENTNYAACDV